MHINKYISNQIEKQFPAIYREDGQELVSLVEDYYSFLEETDNQSLFNNRRIFDYRDIDSTLKKMLIFFKNKYLNDLPFSEENTRFIVKHVLDLYRRKGSKEGIKLFFRLFYNEDVRISYPSNSMLKVSESRWKVDRYIQLFPNDPSAYENLQGKRIVGTISKAEAIVNRVSFILLNNSITPIIFLENVKGSFVGFDNILSNNISYGRVHGSLDSLEVISSDFSLSGNQIGDILDCSGSIGVGGRAIVTDVTDTFSGEIEYDVNFGGFGYSVENTSLIISNQTIITDNSDLKFVLSEQLQDQFGNTGEVIGQNRVSVGVKMSNTDFFTANSIIETIDRVINFTVDFTSVSDRNDSSPGDAYIDVLENQEVISIITDSIVPFVDVPLNANNFYDHANTTFSGSANTVNIDTLLEDAFAVEQITIGSIRNFTNVNPGTDYFNEVFAIASDSLITAYNKRDQILAVDGITVNPFVVGEEIIQNSGEPNEIKGVIRSVQDNLVFVLPYSFNGFTTDPILYRGTNYTLSSVGNDYSSLRLGENAIITSTTNFAVGKITGLKVINSGYGYTDNSTIELKKTGTDTIATLAKVSARGQGFNEGRWETVTSHIGAIEDRKIQDSFYYQDYSYDVLSNIGINKYEYELKQIMHPAGTKFFGTFEYTDTVTTTPGISVTVSNEDNWFLVNTYLDPNGYWFDDKPW